MPKELKTDEIKTRVPPRIKQGLERIAEERHLDASDIQRQAFREFLERNANGQKKKAA